MQLEEKKKKEIEFLEKVFRAGSSTLSNISPIADKQKKAVERISELGFPNRKIEDWKYYDFSPILDNFLSFDTCKITQIEKESLKDFLFPECEKNLLVTVNGHFSEKLSNFSFSKEDISILNFNDPEQLKSYQGLDDLVEKYFAEGIENESNFFKACNTALLSNAFLLKVKEGVQLKETLQILHISNEHCFNQTRSLIHLGANSKINIIVTYVGLAEIPFVNNAVIETVLEEGSELVLDKIQDDTQKGILLYDLKAKLLKNSRFEYSSLNLKANSSRDKISVDIDEEGAHADINGLYILNGERKAHNVITVNHNVGNSTSSQLFKGILSDKARAEFNGAINVARDANGTDAEQMNRDLVLSDEAHVDSRPQLNILADDVKCAHGSTIGDLEEDEIFYLLSRGIKKDDALAMLTLSFCDEVIQKVKIESARQHIKNMALENLDTQMHKANIVHNLR